MKTFIKANVASLVASFCDYLVTILLVQLFFTDKLLAGIAGTVVGGIINFLINRHWVFKTKHSSLNEQGKRYLLTWIGNLALNSFGLYILIKLFKVQYIIAKVATSLLVAVAYNYPIQKRYVFKISD